MDTFLAIALYSVLMLAGLTTVSAVMVMLAKWLADNSEEPDAH